MFEQLYYKIPPIQMQIHKLQEYIIDKINNTQMKFKRIQPDLK